MKGIYLTNCDISNENSGVSKKIRFQIKDFNKNNISIECPDFSRSNILLRLTSALPFCPLEFSLKLFFYFRKVEIDRYDFIYIRKTTFDNLFITTIQRLKKLNSDLRVILEIPTYPYDLEYDSFYRNLVLNKDIKSRNKFKLVFDRIATYSNDSLIFEIPTIKLSNAVDTSEILQKKVVDNGRKIQIIAVAQFSFWHGYDRFIEGMNEYYKNGGNRNLVLNLVGNGVEISKYKQLVSVYKLENHVVFHGELHGSELDKIYDVSDIALDSMGRHRSNISYNSSLKGKEYGAKGLPIVSGVETELDNVSNYKYYCRVDANDQPIDVEKVLDFYDSIYHEKCDKNIIINEIRNFTCMFFDMSSTFRPVIDYILK